MPSEPLTFFNTFDQQGQKDFRRCMYECMKHICLAIGRTDNKYWYDNAWYEDSSKSMPQEILKLLKNKKFDDLTDKKYGFSEGLARSLKENPALATMMTAIIEKMDKHQGDISNLHDSSMWNLSRISAEDARELMVVAAAYKNCGDQGIPGGKAGEIFRDMLQEARYKNDALLNDQVVTEALKPETINARTFGAEDYRGRPEQMGKDIQVLFSALKKGYTSAYSTHTEYSAGYECMGSSTTCDDTKYLTRANLADLEKHFEVMKTKQKELKEAIASNDQTRITALKGQIKKCGADICKSMNLEDENFFRILCGIKINPDGTEDVQGNLAFINMSCSTVLGLTTNYTEACGARDGDPASKFQISGQDLDTIAMGYSFIAQDGQPGNHPPYVSQKALTVAASFEMTAGSASSSLSSDGIQVRETGGSAPAVTGPGGQTPVGRTTTYTPVYQPTGGDIMRLDTNTLPWVNQHGNIVGGTSYTPTGNLSISLPSSNDSSNSFAYGYMPTYSTSNQPVTGISLK